MNSKEYKCSMCGEVFESLWSDEEAIEETHENFGDYEIEDCAVVCDDCYKRMTSEIPIDVFKKYFS
jgi:DNA-directed RNA polymerase subunit RPC12/RpoP